EHENLRASGDLPRQPNRKPVRIGGRKRKLPALESKAPLQFFGYENCIFGRQHQGDSTLDLLFDSFDGRERGMSRYSVGIAEAQFDVAVAVHIVEVSALGFADKGWKCSRPLSHPIHG